LGESGKIRKMACVLKNTLMEANKQMKKITFVLLISMLMAVVAACGNNNNSNSSSSPSGSATPPASESAGASETSSQEAPKEVTLKLGLPHGFEVTNKAIIDGFQAAYPHIKLDMDTTPWGDFVTNIPAKIAGGNPPDIWFQENAVILGYGARGVAEDLAPYFERDINTADYVDAVFSAKTPDGKVYGLPHGTNPIALGYNKKLFADAGIPFPTDDWTYQDLLDAAEKLTKANGSNVEHYGYISGMNITSGWFPWIRATGGQVLDSTLTKAMVNDPKSIEGLTKWSDATKKGIFAPHSFEKSMGGAERVFGQNKAAMYYVQYSTQLFFRNEFPDLDWDTVMIPKNFDGTRTVPMVTNSWLVYSKASPEAKEAAWTFLKYYLGQEAQDLLAVSGASLPVLKSSLAKVDAMTDTKPLNKSAYTKGIAEGGATLDENATWEEWVGAAQPLFEDIYNGRTTVEAGANEITKKIQAILDRK